MLQGTMSGNDFARSLISALGVRHVDLYLEKVSLSSADHPAECHRLSDLRSSSLPGFCAPHFIRA